MRLMIYYTPTGTSTTADRVLSVYYVNGAPPALPSFFHDYYVYTMGTMTSTPTRSSHIATYAAHDKGSQEDAVRAELQIVGSSVCMALACA